MSASDWNPASYARFADLRLRPAIDLLSRVGELPRGEVVDLGCGNGAVGPLLRSRFASRRLTGVDSSPAMLTQARAQGCYDTLFEADAATWEPENRPALIFSNALLQWLPDHDRLLPSLVDQLVPGGVLAVQMPRQFQAPSHQLIRSLAAELFPERFSYEESQAPVADPVHYARVLDPHGDVDVWETDYVQRLSPVSVGHPVRHFTSSTAMRPVAALLSEAEAECYLAAYDRALEVAYPREAEGSVLFPFRRCFLTVRKGS